MNCDDVRELLAAYALDALTEEERRAVRDHLEGCALHPELADWRAAAHSLAAVAEPLAPPIELRARVLALAAPASRVTPLPARRPERAPLLPWALAAGFATLALVLGVWGANQRPSEPTLVHREGTATAGAARARVTYAAAQQLVLFEIDALTPPPAGREYQLWVVRGATPVSLGVFTTTAGGHGVLSAETALAPGEVLAVTVEPVGGSVAPTTPPFLAITY